jgi:hypothetical protein
MQQTVKALKSKKQKSIKKI